MWAICTISSARLSCGPLTWAPSPCETCPGSLAFSCLVHLFAARPALPLALCSCFASTALFLTTFLPAPQVGPSFPDLLHPLAGEYENKGLMIIDEEEFLLILKLKDLKKQYRTEHQDLCDLRAEVQYCQHLVDQCRHRLLTGVPFGELGQPPGVPGGSGQGHRLDSRSGFRTYLWQRQGDGVLDVFPGL